MALAGVHSRVGVVLRASSSSDSGSEGDVHLVLVVGALEQQV